MFLALTSTFDIKFVTEIQVSIDVNIKNNIPRTNQSKGFRVPARDVTPDRLTIFECFHDILRNYQKKAGTM